MSRSLRRAAFALAAASLLVVGLLPGAVSAADTSSGWTDYSDAPADSTVETIQGTSDGAGGCILNLSASLSPGQDYTRADEIAFNSSTCQSKIAFSHGSTAPAEPAEPTDTTTSSSGLVPTTSSSSKITASTDATLATTYRSIGYMKSWYQDPVGLVVNSVKDTTDWYWNRICATGRYGSYYYTWYSPSGWQLKENNFQNYYTCYQTTVSSYAHFRNGIFCFTIDTHTYYDRNTVHGRYDGWLLGNVYAYKSGGCTSLLSFHYALRRTYN